MEDEKLKMILDLLSNEKAEQARKVFQEILPEESTKYWLVKGKIEQKFQNWGGAINAYSKVLEMDSQNHDAQMNLYVIQNILNFWNPEMFNP